MKSNTNVRDQKHGTEPPQSAWAKDFILTHKYHDPNFYLLKIQLYFSKLKMQKLTIISQAIYYLVNLHVISTHSGVSPV